MYIYYHSRTDCFVVSQLFSEARYSGGLKLGSNCPNFTLNMVSNRSAIPVTYVRSGIITHMY